MKRIQISMMAVAMALMAQPAELYAPMRHMPPMDYSFAHETSRSKGRQVFAAVAGKRKRKWK